MKECSLCGGKLDKNKRCTLCGLDNTKNDDMYKHLLNKSKCECEPLTHVHEEPVRTKTSKSYSSATYNTGKKVSKSKKKKGIGSILAALVTIFTIVGTLFGMLEDIMFRATDDSYKEEYYYDTDTYVVDEMPVDGELYQATLEPGIYIVGCHIPKGIYDVEVVGGDCGNITIDDYRNWIYESFYVDTAENLYDIELYNDAIFTVSSNIVVSISTKNAQPLVMEEEENTLTESYVLTDYAVAGEDFAAGIYDIYYDAPEEDCGSVEYDIEGEGTYGEYYYSMSIYFDSYIGAETYHNVIIPEGTQIYLNELESVTLIPSAKVFPVDIQSFYEFYY